MNQLGDEINISVLKIASQVEETESEFIFRFLSDFAHSTYQVVIEKEELFKAIQLIRMVSNSCSTMHKIHSKEFTLDDFSCEHLDLDNYDLLKKTIVRLNCYRDIYINGGIVEYPDCGRQTFESKSKKIKKIWYSIIQLLPSSYNQTRNVMMNYEVLANIYKSRKNHKLNEWSEFCKWIESLPYSGLITGSPAKQEQLMLEKQPYHWIY